MFFGRKEADKVNASGLMQLLNTIFDRKFSSLESRAAGITSQLARAKEGFAASCESFERLNAEPYTEDLWNPNINSIKSQKAAYSTALRNLASEMDLNHDGSNTYEKYMAVLSSVEDTAGKILRTNANFKIVLYCYSNYLRDFKKHFSSIEELRDSLKRELDIRSADYDIYLKVSDNINRLNSQADELEALKNGMASLSESSKRVDTAAIDREEMDISARMNAKRAEIDGINSDISSSSNRIGVMAAPLRKAAKRFDHASGRKAQVTRFIEDPIAAIKSREDYDQFIGLLNDMKRYVEADTSEIKNKIDALQSIQLLLSSDIYSMIAAIDSAKTKRSTAEHEIRELERIMDGLKDGRNSIAKSASQREKLSKDADDISRSRASLKQEIESQLLEYYGKRISIEL